MTTEQCAPVTEVTPPHGSNGSVAGSYGLANFLLMIVMHKRKKRRKENR
jgi:hypothetical protein